MGNHEFCTECGESNFHHHRPCDPERKMRYEEEKRKIKNRKERADQAVIKIVKKLKELGYEAEIDEYGHIIIDKWSLIK